MAYIWEEFIKQFYGIKQVGIVKYLVVNGLESLLEEFYHFIGEGGHLKRYTRRDDKRE